MHRYGTVILLLVSFFSAAFAFIAYDFFLTSSSLSHSHLLPSTEDTGWRHYTSKKDGFSIMLPLWPQTAQSSNKDPKSGEERNSSMHISEIHDGALFMINVITYSEREQLEGYESLEGIRDELLHQHEGNRLLAEKKMDDGSLDFSIMQGDIMMNSRAFKRKNRIYLLTMLAKEYLYQPKDYEKFVASFHFEP